MKLLFCFLFLALVLSANGQEPVHSERLEEISIKISKLQEEQRQINADLLSTEKASAQLAQEIIVVQQNLNASKKELEQLALTTSQLEEEIRDFEDRYVALKNLSSSRIRAMYKLGGGQQMAINLSSEKNTNLGKISYYMSEIRSQELANLKELKRLSSERNIRIEELKAQESLLIEIKSKTQQQQEELKKKQLALEQSKANLKKQKSNKARILVELRAEALRLETVLSSLDEVQSDLAPESNSIKAEEENAVKEKPISSNLPGLGSRFRPPSSGSIVLKFGALTAEGSEEKVKSKGIGFIAGTASDVLSVGQAKVSFIGNLGSYGSVIILDHGNRMYSLYSQLAEILVKVGDVVEDGQTIAKVGSINDSRAYNLYFELRVGGKAVDPLPYLR